MPKRLVPFPVLMMIAALVLTAGCGDDDPANPAQDTTPPAAVGDLRIRFVEGASMTIDWTAPGDDGDQGRADQYDVRTSSQPITAASWADATPAAGVPVPDDPGTAQSTAIELPDKASVYVALKTADEVPNWSDLSNVATRELPSTPFENHKLTDRDSNDYPNVHNGVVVWARDSGLDGDEIYMFDLQDPTAVITRRTGSGGQKRFPSNIDVNYIVWSGRVSDSEDWEIHTCSGPGMCQLTQFTDNDFDDIHPVALGTHRFVWEQRQSGFFAEIRYYDIDNGVDLSLSDDCCPLYDYTSRDPDGDGDWVVWRSTDVSVTEFRAHFKNVVTGTYWSFGETIDAGDAFSTDDGDLAFEGANGAEIWINYWNGDEIQPIAAGSSPSLNEGRVAYESWNGHHYEVHYWDGSTIHEITPNNNLYHDAQPCLNGDWLVWVRRTQGGSGEIWYTRVRDS